jgi:hypothetical protein
MKFYYIEDVDQCNCQVFSTKKAALNWIKSSNNRHADWEDDEPYWTKEDIKVMNVPHLTKKSLLWAFIDISMIVGSKIYAPEIEDYN